MVLAIIGIVASYMLGSITFSIVIAKWLKGIDIRQHGSGNAGATNTLRVLGKGPGISVFVLDIAKGVGAVGIGYWIGTEALAATPVLCGLAAIIGHNWPLWFRFKGGKGIATTIGVMATLAFFPVLYAGLIAILSIVITRYVSLGSLIFAALVPVFVFALLGAGPILWASLLIGVFAFVRHRTNIAKLVQGKENKLGGGREVSHGK